MSEVGPSVYRPQPPEPSPAWRRAASRLGLVSTALWVTLPVNVAAMVASTWVREDLLGPRTHSELDASVLGVVHAVNLLRIEAVLLLWVLAYAALARAPLGEPARRGARFALAWCVFDMLTPLGTAALTMFTARASVASLSRIMLPLQAIGLTLALGSTVARSLALSRAAQVVDPPRVAPLVLWTCFGLGLHLWGVVRFAMETVARAVFPLSVWGIEAVDLGLLVAGVVGMTRALRPFAASLASQTTPDP